MPRLASAYAVNRGVSPPEIYHIGSYQTYISPRSYDSGAFFYLNLSELDCKLLIPVLQKQPERRMGEGIGHQFEQSVQQKPSNKRKM